MKTILVVDDEFGIADTLAAVLGDEGYRVMLAANGELALALLAQAAVSLILLDFMMPIMDGRETLAALRADPVLRGIPVIMMSAVSPSLVRRACPDAEYLEKPFELDQLLHLVQRLIGPAVGHS